MGQYTSRQIEAKPSTQYNVDALVPLMVKHNGCIFGDYVRDALIRKREVDHADLWFKTNTEACRFLAELRNTSTTYEPAKCYDLYHQIPVVLDFTTPHPFRLNIIVAPTLPVHDVDCNQVTYDGVIRYHGENPNLVDDIKAGRARVLPTYANFIRNQMSKHPNSASEIANHMINHRMELIRCKGFVITGDEEISNMFHVAKHSPANLSAKLAT